MKRTDIKRILIIGSGPIVIGQGCEFDYSGVQACKALREAGYEVVLVNSNPATVMTDADLADRTYIEPLSPDILHEVIRRERPDALLPTLGGQTALNLAMALHKQGILERYHVELIGAQADSIARAEDRELFKECMIQLGLSLPRSGSAHSLESAKEIAKELVAARGSFELVIRPGFTLGGTGGGIARSWEELETIVNRGLEASLNHEVLIEESLIGWKEYEMEVMCDAVGNAVIVCSIENLDPMGVHTGDSITVAPIQTLTDREYQAMRDDSLAVMRAIGITTGGANVQWAVEPNTGRRIIIEMNPRVSRSSALASKATGFPIAKIAALLAIGYTLPELRNDITQTTPACFEPALDYVVVKVPRFTFEKFSGSDTTLGTQMKSVGEAMAIGRTFTQAFQKALRSLETGFTGFGACAKCEPFLAMDDETLRAEVVRPNPSRLYEVYAALKRGWTVDALAELTGIDRFFLRPMAELVAFEQSFTAQDLLRAKALGYSDAQLGYLLNCAPAEIAAQRHTQGIEPIYGAVDTCAGEFKAITPYYYSTYVEHASSLPPVAPLPCVGTKKQSILILGGGPNRIGQGIEFDYCCVQVAFALREAGYEVVMLNSNPETVSTDYDTSDKLYFEPLTLEDVMAVYRREGCSGVMVQFGGQTPLNLAQQLKTAGANVLGTSPEDIALAEDRDFFKALASEIGIHQPANGIAHTEDEAVAIAEQIGYPVLVRPSFVLGGRGMVIVYKEKYLRKFVAEAVAVAEGRPILIDRFLQNAVELDVDAVSDGVTTTIGAILEHVEPAGIHSGDSASITPPMTLSPKILQQVRDYTHAFATRLHVCGLMNMQLAVKDDELYMIEVNPRASRTVPFVSKAIGRSMAGIAARCMMGERLTDLRFTQEVKLPYVVVKEAVFPFVKFPGIDITLSPEMKSTGEVMSFDRDRGLAYLKSQLAAGGGLPAQGGVFLSVKDEDKDALVPLATELQQMGYTLFATRGTSTRLCDAGVRVNAVFRISRGRPNLIDLLQRKEIQWIVNTTESGAEAMVDELQMRWKALAMGIPITTTLAGLRSAMEGLKDKATFGRFEVCSLQEYHRHLPPSC